MSQRGWVGWILENRLIASMGAVALALALVGVGVVATHSSSHKVAANGAAGSTGGTEPAPVGGTLATLPGQTPNGTGPGAGSLAPGGSSGAAGRGSLTLTPRPISPNVIPGTQAQPACTPTADSETGISPTQVRVGQIVSDTSVLPAQLKPNNYGLQAYFNLVNKSGGICGRKLVIDYDNDGGGPATHDYSSMIHRDFAFVANSSLFDSEDYQSDAPFNPTAQDNGEFVPDVGGLAYSYGRAQSPYFAGTVGSLSPSLTGGALYQYILNQAKSVHGGCRKAGVAYLREPTGASQDQGRLGEAALAASWGANLGTANVKEYENNLDDPVPAYEVTVTQMINDGVNCVFTFSDLQSDINLVTAMAAQGVWPPDKCIKGPQCFAATYVPFAAYDPSFVSKAGDAARDVQSWIPHLPLNESNNPALQLFENALKSVPGATPGTFSLIGFASGVMFAQALEACDPAPSRACITTYLRELQGFTGAGLIGPVTPFRSTKVSCASGCGNFSGKGVYNWKWIFNCGVNVQVLDRNGKRDFYRINPDQGFTCSDLRIARGSPA